MIKARIALVLLTLFVWLLLSWSIDTENIVIGIIAGLIVSFITAEMFAKDWKIFKGIGRYPWFLYYILFFVWECIKANIDGAYRVTHPNLPIHPGIVKVKTTLTSDVGLTFLANSITLKPGTMTVDIDKENGFLYVHWSDVKTQDIKQATAIIVARFERVLKRIFD